MRLCFFRELSENFRVRRMPQSPRVQGQGCSELCLQQTCKPKNLFIFIFLTAQPCLIFL